MEIFPLQHQLEILQCLPNQDMAILLELLTEQRTVEKGSFMINEAESVSNLAVLSKGWAYRFKTLEDGRRQILNFCLPGDIVGFFALLFKKSDHGVEALTPVTYHCFSCEKALEAFRRAPSIAVAMSWLVGRAERQLGEHVVRVGRRGASERMAHLFIELYLRLSQVGLHPEDAKLLPLTQTILADTLGMSHIHANRSFKKLVREQLVAIENNKVHLRDIDALKDYANFDADYLVKGPLPSSVSKFMGNGDNGLSFGNSRCNS